ncbi:thioredoxin family protein [Lactobacillus sp. ESL0681]|uniref:thioredoxin family protein n=1 Tax=Lactobacillus sp. ESL0681 TaxID=2983211 RepID=UPI0023F6FDD9|nr:thioredoxin family protein [Lactobacillus sp. ESL0681]WEV39925.1 thioredoxin family protein [Lactobacillus sp. ESL0681]
MKNNRKKVNLTVICLILLALTLLIYCSYSKYQSDNSKHTSNIKVENVKQKNTLSVTQLVKKIKEKDTFSIIFYGSSCPPCKKELKALKKVNVGSSFFYLDLDKVEDISNKTFKKLNVEYTPTIMKFYQGKPVLRQESYVDINVLKK